MKETLMDQAEHLARMVCKLLRPSLTGEGPVVDTIDLRRLHELAYAWLNTRHDPSIPDPASAVPALVGALEGLYANARCSCSPSPKAALCVTCKAGRVLSALAKGGKR